MHANTGYFEDAAKITRNHVKAFEPVLDGEWDAIVVPSGSCTGAVRHEQKVVAEHVGDHELAKQSQRIAAHTYDLTELLTDVLGLEDVGAYFPTPSPTTRPATRCVSPRSAIAPTASCAPSRA